MSNVFSHTEHTLLGLGESGTRHDMCFMYSILTMVGGTADLR